LIISGLITKKRAKTFNYSYNAWDPKTNKNLIRYCSPHLDHNKFHHKHDYTVDPDETNKIGNDEWPHVSEFLEEVLTNF
jgi:hypothetical protein